MNDDFGDVEIQVTVPFNTRDTPPAAMGFAKSDASDSEDDFNVLLNADDDSVEGNNYNARTNNVPGGNGISYTYEEEEEGFGLRGVRNRSGNNVSDPNPVANGNGVEGGYITLYKHGRPYVSSFPSNRNAEKSAEVGSCSSKFAYWGNREDNGRGGHGCAIGNSIASYSGYGFSLPRNRTIVDVNIDVFEEKRWRSPGVDISDFFNFGFNENSWKDYCSSLDQFRQQSYAHMFGRIPVHVSSKLPEAHEFGSKHVKVAEEATKAEDAFQVGSKDGYGKEDQFGLPKGQAIQVEESNFERQPTMDLRCPCSPDSDVVIQIKLQDCNDHENSSGSTKECGHLDSAGLALSEGKDVDVDQRKDINHVGFASENALPAVSLDGNFKAFSSERSGQLLSWSTKMPADPEHCLKDNISDANASYLRRVIDHISEDCAEAAETVEKAEEEAVRNMCESSQGLIETESSISGKIHFGPTVSFSGSDSESSMDGIFSIPEESFSPLRRPSSGTDIHESVSYEYETSNSHNSIRNSSSRRLSPNENSVTGWQVKKVPEWRISADTGNIHDDASPKSVYQSSVHPHKWIEQLCGSDNHDGEDFSYAVQRDHSCAYGKERFSEKYFVERFSEEHFSDIYTSHPQRKHDWRCQDVMKLRDGSNLDEELYRMRFMLKNQDDMDRNWYCRGSQLHPGESRWLALKSDKFKERDEEGKENDEFPLGNYHRSRLFDETNLDHPSAEKYGRSIPSSNRRSYLDGSWCIGIVDEYQQLDHQSLSSWSHGESDRRQYRASPRSDTRDSLLAGKSQRYSRRMGDENNRNRGRVGICDDASDTEDDIIYRDNPVHLWRTKYDHQSKIWSDIHDKSISKCPHGECYFERESHYGKKTSRRQRSYASRYVNAGLVSNRLQFEQPKNRNIRGQISAKCVKNFPAKMYRCEREHTVRKSSDPADLIVGKRKSSERVSQEGGWTHRGKLGEVDRKFVKKRRVSGESEESEPQKGIQTDAQRSEVNDKYLDEYNNNNDSDIEEGQIVTEELKMEKCVPGSTASMQNGKKRTPLESGNGTDEEAAAAAAAYGNQRILETMAKMEKRRERFKDPIITACKEPDKSWNLQENILSVDKLDNKQERPTRKRRWGGR